MLRAYFSHGMTGRNPNLVLLESDSARLMADIIGGIELIDPVVIEGIQPGAAPIQASQEQLNNDFWKRDKFEIRRSHVVITNENQKYSHGVVHEIGYARYFLYKPVIRVWPGLGPSVTWTESDYVAPNLYAALQFAKDNFGTWQKRLLWRLKLLAKLPKAVLYKGMEWVNIFG